MFDFYWFPDMVCLFLSKVEVKTTSTQKQTNHVRKPIEIKHNEAQEKSMDKEEKTETKE
jgi:hypothetical protein